MVAHKGLLDGIATPVPHLVASEGRLAKVGKPSAAQLQNT